MLRFVTSIALARLLAPQLFGLMLIVGTFRAGIELFSDVGIGQNIVYSKNAEDPDFYNTAWSLQIIRSVAIWVIFIALSAPVAYFYKEPVILYILPVAGFGIIFSGLNSVSPALLQKRLLIARVNIFELVVQLVSAIGAVLFAFFSRTIWALVAGGLFTSAVYTIGSYFLLPNLRHKLYLSKQYSMEILHFGKWIFLSSVIFFLSVNYDRLYFAKVIPIELLGVYGIARNISDLIVNLVGRLGYNVVFPFIASHSQTPRAALHQQLARPRAAFLLLVAAGASVLVATADLAIRLLYDQRYSAATWMLPVLIVGAWFSVLGRVNESILLGLGKPSYATLANAAKFAFLLVGLPLSVAAGGLLGGVLVVALVDLPRYLPILIGQRRQRLSYGMQDLKITIVMFLLIGLWEFLRWQLGFGTSFDSLPSFEFKGFGG